MSTDDPDSDLTRAVDRVRRRLTKTGELRRQEVRLTLRKELRHLADEAADVLVDEEVAVKAPAPQGSWVLRLVGLDPEQTRPPATLYATCADSTGVVYKLVDAVLHGCVTDDGQRHYDRAFAQARQALGRLDELRQRDRDAVATDTLRRLRQTRGTTA